MGHVTASNPMRPSPDRPIIGVTVRTEEYPAELIDAVERSGGTPLPLNLTSDLSTSDALERVEGVVVGSSHGVGAHPDAVELIVATQDAGLPLLCIGSGMQALNTASGGSTVSLVGHGPDGERGSSYHRVYIAPGSRLATIVGSGGFVRVNSQHRAGVREAQKSPELMASAYSLEDGVIEALESPKHPWIIGVQFLPERRLELPPHFGRLFEALVAQSKRVSGRKK